MTAGVHLAEAAAPLPATPVLARLRFDAESVEAPGVHRVPLPRLGADRVEVWPAAAPVREFRDHGFEAREDGAQLFFWRHVADARDIEAATEQAYRELLALTRERDYPALLRLWNFFDGVTRGDGDEERYRRFCLGRHRALAAPGFEARLPAATVIGTSAPGLWIYGFAGREPGVPVENPRQTAAYRYPRDYGPRSPSFARATRLDAASGAQLFVSGTAAIVGHRTRHPQQLLPQAREMLANVDALLHAAGPQAWRASALKLYLRDGGADALREAAIAAVRARFGADAPLLVLQGEVCRRDLVVEIEGVFASA